MKTRLTTLTAILFLLLAPVLAAAESLTILHLNDFHGALEPVRTAADRPEEGGAARLAALVRAERTPAALFLAGGDLMQGTNLSNLFAGKPVIEILNLMGLDASAVGNHEFDNGQAALAERAAEARFPFLAANIEGPGPWKRSEVRRVGAVRVALFGLTTEETPVATHPRNVTGLVFTDTVAAARSLVAELRPQADLVVALTHLGFEEDEKLAAAVPGIDVIVGGHTHTKLEQPALVGSTLVVQAFERGAVLGRLDLEIADGKVASHRYRLVPVTAAAGEDPAVAAVVAGYAAQLGEKMREPVGTAGVDLDGAKDALRSRETNLGDLVADVMREAAGADVALVNGGTIRAAIPAGPVTVGAIYNALPFDNWLIAFALTGKELRAALETGVSRVEVQDGGFPQVSGMRYVFDPRRPAGERIVSVEVGGAPLDETRTYTLATHDFLAAGGNGYTVFAGHDPVYNDSGHWLRDVLAAWWRRRGSIAPTVDGRIAATGP
ncbi:MAG TPA: 5'-nucleotidase C-terminal domain-containing protein [Candidatus Methanoperedens sp.]|nr:5'-nucleotidase C-terminal domain-containing protein [Candidatus Methanoperedens sp.]